MSKTSNRNSLVLIAAAILIVLAQTVYPAAKKIDGTLKLGGIGIDEQYGSLASVQETYNIYDGFNVAQVLVNGYLGLVESMIRKFLDQSAGSCKTVATGGDAPFFVEELDLIEVHDPDLLLKGIALAFEAAHVD